MGADGVGGGGTIPVPRGVADGPAGVCGGSQGRLTFATGSGVVRFVLHRDFLLRKFNDLTAFPHCQLRNTFDTLCFRARLKLQGSCPGGLEEDARNSEA